MWFNVFAGTIDAPLKKTSCPDISIHPCTLADVCQTISPNSKLLQPLALKGKNINDNLKHRRGWAVCLEHMCVRMCPSVKYASVPFPTHAPLSPPPIRWLLSSPSEGGVRRHGDCCNRRLKGLTSSWPSQRGWLSLKPSQSSPWCGKC